MSASEVAAFDSHQTDPAKLQQEIQDDFGYGERVMSYMGHVIRISQSRYSYGYVVTIDGHPIQGNFPGIYTAYDRAKLLIDKGRV